MSENRLITLESDLFTSGRVVFYFDGMDMCMWSVSVGLVVSWLNVLWLWATCI